MCDNNLPMNKMGGSKKLFIKREAVKLQYAIKRENYKKEIRQKDKDKEDKELVKQNTDPDPVSN
jgi:hypothetical protein